LNTKEDILKNAGNQLFFLPYGSQRGQSTVWLPMFIKISSFLFSKRKKFIQVWINLRVSF